MRGTVNIQSSLFSYVSPESRIPSSHPLRDILVCIVSEQNQNPRTKSPQLALTILNFQFFLTALGAGTVLGVRSAFEMKRK